MEENTGTFDYNQLVAPGIGAGAAFLGSIPQMIEARRLRKERERLLQQGAPGLSPIEQEQMAAARARAASALAPGYGQEMEGIAQQQADILAAGKRGSATPSNLINLLSKMNAQGQAARRNLAIRGAQAQRTAQGDLTNLSMSADARRQARVQNWEAKLAAMDAARRQYNAAAGMAPLQGAIAFMPAEGLKFGTGTKSETTPSPYKSFAEIPTKFSETEKMYNPYEGKTGMRMAAQTSDMGPGATPVMSGLYPTPPQEQPSYMDQTYNNMFSPKAAARRAGIIDMSNRPTRLPPGKEYPNPTGLERRIPQVNLRVRPEAFTLQPPTASNNFWSY